LKFEYDGSMGEAGIQVEQLISLQPHQILHGEFKPKPSASLVERLKIKAGEHPESTRLELLDFTNDEVRAFSASDYNDFLHLGMETEQPALLFAKHSRVLAERFDKDPRTYHDSDWGLAHSICEETRMVLWTMAGDPTVTVPPDVLDTFYRNIRSDNRFIRLQSTEYIANLVYLDNRNLKHGDRHLDLSSRYRKDTVDMLSHPKTQEEYETGRWLVEEAWAEWPSLLPELMVDSLRQADDGLVPTIFSLFANRLGLSESRKMLRDYAEQHVDFQPQLKRLEQVLGFGKQPGRSLQDLYVKILPEFQNYQPNKDLLDYERKLLHRVFRKTPKILDAGHGPNPRHLTMLKEMGKKVFGFDFVAEYVQAAKKMSPDLDVVNADWHHMPYADGSVDGIVCLGRSIGHNTTIDDYIGTLREMRRVMGTSHDDHIRKRAVIDMPSLQQGDYKVGTQKADKIANNMNILYREPGFIHDSPGTQESYDRLFLTPSQFTAAARLSGFRATHIGSSPYGSSDVSSHNTNIYWLLEPIEKPASFEETLKLTHKLHRGSPPLELIWA